MFETTLHRGGCVSVTGKDSVPYRSDVWFALRRMGYVYDFERFAVRWDGWEAFPSMDWKDQISLYA